MRLVAVVDAAIVLGVEVSDVVACDEVATVDGSVDRVEDIPALVEVALVVETESVVAVL